MSNHDADALVVFGITGDLARKMTLRSLYRLEARGLLTCPVIGVAVNDWSVEQLREQAHESIAATGEQIDEDIFGRLAGRLGYVSGDFSDEQTYERVAQALGDAHNPTFYLEIPPSLLHGDRGALEGWARGRPQAGHRREALRPRPRVGPRTRIGSPSVPRRVPALPHRSLPRQDGASGNPLSAVRKHDARTGLEPQLPRMRPDHDGRAPRGRGPRPFLRPGGRVARRGRQSSDPTTRLRGDGTTVRR